ncbi:MAG: hypothetical protein JJV97_05370 [SAR324 cluster bacterium]|nr:hypothetical protein [SAR324 cluster bacterium]
MNIKLSHITGLMLLLIPLTIGLISCSSAKSRHQKTNIWQNLASPYQTFAQQKRSGNIYNNFKLELEVNAILKNQEYIARLSDASSKANLRPRDINHKDLANQAEGFDFLLSFYSPAKELSSSTILKRDWQFELLVDGDATTTLVSIKKIDGDSFEYKYLQKSFYDIDRWSNLFLISFSRPLKYANNNPASLKLKISGIAGLIELLWEPPQL